MTTHAGDCSCYPCRGRKARQTHLLHKSQAAVAAQARVYSNAEKQRVRGVILRAVTHLGGPYLTLWGGGEDARQVAALGVSVMAAENNRAFRPAMEADAGSAGYGAYAGDVTRVEGEYRVINLDTMCGIDRAAELAAQMTDKLARGGLMFVTIMGTDRHEKWRTREVAYAAVLSAVTGLRSVAAFRYRMLSGVPAYVIGLSADTKEHRSGRTERRTEMRPDVIHDQVKRDGFYHTPRWALLAPRHGDPEHTKSRLRRWRHQRLGLTARDRKCLRPGCEEVISAERRPDQKYCSHSCGTTEWWRLNVLEVPERHARVKARAAAYMRDKRAARRERAA